MARLFLRVRDLIADEGRQLNDLLRIDTDARAVRRGQVVRLSLRGLPPRRIGDPLDRSGSGVRKVVNRFNHEGMASLFDRPHVGRLSKVTERYVTLLKAAVAKGPKDMGYAFTAWTLDRLREHLLRGTKVSLSPAHLSRLLHAHGIVYRPPKQGMSHLCDPR
jgi:transposase